MLTTAGTVEVFEYQLNGAVDKKPIKSSCCLKIQTSAGSALPVLACQLTDQDKLTVMYGTSVCPGFDHVSLVCYIAALSYLLPIVCVMIRCLQFCSLLWSPFVGVKQLFSN